MKVNWLLFVAVLIVGTLAATVGSIELKGEAVVTGKYVNLLDLIRNDGLTEDVRKELSGVFLGRSPAVGETRTISLGEILAELERRGISPDRFGFSGESVLVRRVPGDPVSDALVARMAEFLRAKLRLDPKTRKLQIIEIHSADPASLKEASPMEIVDPSTVATGVHVLRVRIKTPSGRDSVAEVQVRVTEIIQVVQAARDIPMGKIVYAEEVQMAAVESVETELYVTELKLAVGSRTVRPVKKGSLLTRDMIKFKSVIRRRDLVRAQNDYIIVDARALQEGGVGDVIELEYENTKNRFKGKVVSSSLVQILE